MASAASNKHLHWQNVAALTAGMLMIALGGWLMYIALPEAETPSGNAVGRLGAGLVIGGVIVGLLIIWDAVSTWRYNRRQTRKMDPHK
jgi:hypothetical protein